MKANGYGGDTGATGAGNVKDVNGAVGGGAGFTPPPSAGKEGDKGGAGGRVPADQAERRAAASGPLKLPRLKQLRLPSYMPLKSQKTMQRWSRKKQPLRLMASPIRTHRKPQWNWAKMHQTADPLDRWMAKPMIKLIRRRWCSIGFTSTIVY